METNLEEAIELDQLACYVGLSRRQLERLFQKYLQCSPSRYYLKLRLTKARQLLKQTSMSIIEVASACGFVSTPHFSKCYREHIGIPPREERMGMRVTRNAEALMDPMSRSLGTVFGGLGDVASSTALTALTEAQSEPSYGSVTLQ
jgi:AraC-like DNA-binding protein